MNAPASSAVALSELKRDPAPREQRMPVVLPGFGDLQSFELLQRIGKMWSQSPMVPDIYKGADGLSSCCIALNMALRMNADPLMVMQNLDIISGRPSWRSTFLIACFNQCGRFTAIRYRWQGTEGKDDWGCRAFAIETSTAQEIIGPLVTIALAKAEGWFDRKGTKWKTIPELMLMYRASAWMIRSHAPEIAMGLPTREESEDIVLTPDQYRVEQVKAGDHAQESAAVSSEPAKAAETPPASAANASAQANPAAAQTFAAVAEAIKLAETPDSIDAAKATIILVSDERQRAELDIQERAKRKAINAALDAKA